MRKFKEFDIDLAGLANKQHDYQYVVDDAFFALFENSLVEVGKCGVSIALNKTETMLICDFDISGSIRLTCDRSLELFDYPIKSTEQIIFKYGDEAKELSDEIIIIPRELTTLNLAQYIYEFIGLCVPIKKLHPRFIEEDLSQEGDADEDILVYSSTTISSEEDDSESSQGIDPRWEDLKKLIK
ncbi:YceD family protein [Thermoflexibacter ruber]|uniref:Uncharacterized metal-binding protein YceD, DUF177 family n=1 Tax=Thermoflexibacter ruber TaxID=1003 RepID=A0A1I2HDP0_9BACT|nr:DUF177 domain-containing protein [Thermoflexibacter ruber]SFF27420.1 Uncharacterized metal-binding protein YceD, DUF177 family [Thermoflexibacter ruber]